MGAKTKIIVSSRGQVTPPSAVRKHLRCEIEYYSDKQIQEWLKDDRLGDRERKRLERKLKRIKG